MTLAIRSNAELAKHHDKLDEMARQNFNNAKADNTKKSYKSDWQDFEEWCKLNNFQSMPATIQIVIRYLTDRAYHSWTRLISKRVGRGKNMRIMKVPVTFQPLKPSSIERKLSAISKAHQYAGHRFDRKNVILTETLNGIKREKGVAQERKNPILSDDIKAMSQSLSGISGVRDKAIILIGFTGAFRRSEIVSLQLSDLTEVKGGFDVTLRFSKTDQMGEGKIKAIPYGDNPETCPVKAIKAWLDEMKKADITDGPLFRPIDQYGQIRSTAIEDKNGEKKIKGICAASIALIIKRNEHLKDTADKFGGHSLRAGFCTQAALNGVPDSIGMLQSGHKDANSYNKYVRLADRWKNCAATKLGL